jgi:hypothetical protein
MVAELESNALKEISPILRERRETVLARVQQQDPFLRAAYAELEVRNYKRTYDECLDVLKKTLAAA